MFTDASQLHQASLHPSTRCAAAAAQHIEGDPVTVVVNSCFFSSSDLRVPVEMFWGCKAPPGRFVQLLHTEAAHSTAAKGQGNKTKKKIPPPLH